MDENKQCCGSMTFWYGSGSVDQCLWQMDPDPAIFAIDLQDANNNCFKTSFSAYYHTSWRYIYITFQRKKSEWSHKTVGIKVCLTIFAWWWKDPDLDPGGPQTFGSGSATLKRSASICGTDQLRVQACGGVPADSGDHGQVQDPHVRGGNQRGQYLAVDRIRIGSGFRKAKKWTTKK